MNDATVWCNIDELQYWDRNPNEGDIGKIIVSIREFGFNDTCQYWNSIIKGGNHSVMALKQLRKDGWHPDQCEEESRCLSVNGDGWQIAMIDTSAMGELKSNAFGLALNGTQRAGRDDPAMLAELLQEVANSTELALESTSFSADDLDELLRDLGNDFGDDNNYSRKIEAPTYEPSGDKPQLDSLFDDSRTQELIIEIDNSDLPEDEKAFLRIAAQRHTVLDFGEIASYYAHSELETQNLMENNALVIIDFNKAIELGFVQLTENIANMVGDEYGG